MRPEHVPSSPHFFRPVLRAMAAWIVVLVVAARFVRAPLDRAADPAHAPNPAKAAWFLLWIQEVVSHGTAWIFVVALLAIAFVLLPWARRAPFAHAEWFRRGERAFLAGVAGLVLAVIALTIVAMWFRGEAWQFVRPS